MRDVPMVSRLSDVVGRWSDALGLDPSLRPGAVALEALESSWRTACREGAEPRQLAAWEARHGFLLPRGLRAWLALSDGFFLGDPLVHPLSGIGPMIPFAQVPDLLVQPESWFELGNPPTEPICIDLAYTWPDGGCPIFTSGDDERQSQPRVIAPSFEAWFLRLLDEGGREYWLDPGFVTLGNPWVEHRRRTPAPPLPPRLRRLAPRVRPLMLPGADDRSIASDLGISRGDLEAIFRHLQHADS
ncbi:MAG TPA: SMI1/KNR4 family protein [Isosphaeraceae bacterium]|jgi:hypothetical protein|nr:SMI1/KNR4 family protein [Isosphaeraceae bacterium]